MRCTMSCLSVTFAPMVSDTVCVAIKPSSHWRRHQSIISLCNIPKKPEFKIWQLLSCIALKHFIFTFVYYLIKAPIEQSNRAAAYRGLCTVGFLIILVTFTSGVTAILMVGTLIFLGHNSSISAPLPKTDKPQDHPRKHNNLHRQKYQKPIGNPLLCTRLDGAMSITDHHFNDGSNHLPLWIILFWWRVI